MKRLVLFSAVLLLASCATHTKAPDPSAFAEADSVIYKSIEAGTIPGAVLYVMKDRELVYHRAYGNKSVSPDTVAMTEDVVFDLASISKPLATTSSLMQLWDKGLVDLKANIGTYLKDFAPQENITLEQLLTHTSGLPNYHGHIQTTGYYGRPDSLLRFVATELPRIPKEYYYSCFNFFLVQQVVEKLSGERLCDYATEHIFRPLGMNDTRYHPINEPIDSSYRARIAPLYTGDKMLIGDVQDGLARRVGLGNGGNAGVFSCADDLIIFSKMLLNGGQLNGVRILSKEAVRRISTAAAEGRTLGWDQSSAASGVKGDYLSGHLICHTGYSGTFLLIDFDNDLVIILLSNRCHPADTGYAALKEDRALVCNAIARTLGLAD